MGNVTSNGTTALAMMAVARSLRLQRFQIIMMRESLKAFSDEAGFVDRKSFDMSLMRSKITQPAALEIFDLLFTMWDHFDVQRIPAKKFAVGIAPLACSCDDLSSVLRFSLHINDECNNGRISPRDLHDVLISIDNTASYFGDAHLEPGDIDSVVEAVFDGRKGPIPYELCVRKLQNNAYIKRFISGKTRSRVQFKPDLEIATELDHQQEEPILLDLMAQNNNTQRPTPRPTPRAPLSPNVVLHKDSSNLTSFDGEENSENRQLYDPLKPKRSGSGLDDSWASFITTDTTSKSIKDPPSTVFVPLEKTTPYAKSPLGHHNNRDPPSFRQ